MNLLAVAHHEAAHVVVGLALGLRLRRVVAGVHEVADGTLAQGYTQFDGRFGSVEAWAIMYAAGSAWEKRNGDPGYAWADVARLRERGVKSAAAIAALEHAAWCILMRAADAHARITRALHDERELTRESLEELMGT